MYSNVRADRVTDELALGSETKREIKNNLCFSLLNWWSGSFLYWNEDDLERKGFNQELYFRHVKFEMPIRHVGGDIGQALKLSTREKTGVGGVSLEAICFPMEQTG